MLSSSSMRSTLLHDEGYWAHSRCFCLSVLILRVREFANEVLADCYTVARPAGRWTWQSGYRIKFSNEKLGCWRCSRQLRFFFGNRGTTSPWLTVKQRACAECVRLWAHADHTCGSYCSWNGNRCDYALHCFVSTSSYYPCQYNVVFLHTFRPTCREPFP